MDSYGTVRGPAEFRRELALTQPCLNHLEAEFTEEEQGRNEVDERV